MRKNKTQTDFLWAERQHWGGVEPDLLSCRPILGLTSMTMDSEGKG